ncbi:hypothetical protein RRG08_024254 [Elysia crispata]|uniref:Uncharacterized protein n=1 Tax=Elysia crispata TaxID=231223 RepID=A0AAE1D8P6_9GAST|nr:hypothetical protein RRG08_024254 [Elysia crispata]
MAATQECLQLLVAIQRADQQLVVCWSSFYRDEVSLSVAKTPMGHPQVEGADVKRPEQSDHEIVSPSISDGPSSQTEETSVQAHRIPCAHYVC